MKTRQPNIAITRECAEYKPIQTANHPVLDYDISNHITDHETGDDDDAGCDSCAHFSNGNCNVYNQKN